MAWFPAHSMWMLPLSSRSVMSNSLWPHGLQHIRLPCPSLSPGNSLKVLTLRTPPPTLQNTHTHTHTHTHTGLPAGSLTCRHLLLSGSLHWLTRSSPLFHTNMVNSLFKWLFMSPSQWGLPWPSYFKLQHVSLPWTSDLLYSVGVF